MWDGLGLGKWDYAEATELAKYATGWRFKNYTEEARDGAISNQKVEHGATLVAKYKGIRFYDEDAGEGRPTELLTYSIVDFQYIFSALPSATIHTETRRILNNGIWFTELIFKWPL